MIKRKQEVDNGPEPIRGDRGAPILGTSQRVLGAGKSRPTSLA